MNPDELHQALRHDHASFPVVHQAAFAGDDYLMEQALLLSDAQDVDAKHNGYTPLHIAVLYQRHSMIEKLLRAGCCPAIKTPFDFCAMHLAVWPGDLEAARALVAEGADVRHDMTFLNLAVESGHSEMVRYLLERGAKCHDDEETALIHAVLNEKPEIVKVLYQACPVCHGRLRSAMSHEITDDDLTNDAIPALVKAIHMYGASRRRRPFQALPLNI